MLDIFRGVSNPLGRGVSPLPWVINASLMPGSVIGKGGVVNA